jgi:hypothetical protein
MTGWSKTLWLKTLWLKTGVPSVVVVVVAPGAWRF